VALLREAVGHFNDPNTRDQYFNLHVVDAVIHGYEGLEPGLPNIKRYYQVLWDAFPDVHLTLEDMFSAKDRVANRFSIEGTHRG
jgi:predicted ester cyclase